MASGDPIVEQITLAIVEQLQQIMVSNGYARDVAAVVRPGVFYVSDEQDAPQDYSITVFQDSRVPIDKLNLTGGEAGRYAHWFQSYAIVGSVTQADSGESAVDVKLNDLQADIEKALTVDQSEWLGNLALCLYGVVDEVYRAEIVEVQAAVFRGYPGVLVEFWVPYRTLHGDPYSLS